MNNQDAKEKYSQTLEELRQYVRGYLDFLQRNVQGSHDEILESAEYEEKYKNQIIEKCLETIKAAKMLQIPDPEREIFRLISDILKNFEMKPEFVGQTNEKIAKMLRDLKQKLGMDSPDAGENNRRNVIIADLKNRTWNKLH